jgi:hypothetical protein
MTTTFIPKTPQSDTHLLPPFHFSPLHLASESGPTRPLLQAIKMIRLRALLLAALVAVTNAAPTLQDHQSGDTSAGREPRKRGIAFNDPNFVKLFNHPQSRAHWIYNWDSASPPYDKHHEFVPMLWSHHNDHTNRWGPNVDKCAQMGNGPINVLSFNEPDQCG